MFDNIVNRPVRAYAGEFLHVSRRYGWLLAGHRRLHLTIGSAHDATLVGCEQPTLRLLRAQIKKPAWWNGIMLVA